MAAASPFDATNTTFKLIEFCMQLKDVSLENRVFINVMQRVRDDIEEAFRLMRNPKVQEHFEDDPGKRERAESTILSVKSALNSIGRFVEALRVDEERYGSIGLFNRFEWVLRHQAKLGSRQLELDTCHKSLLQAINMMQMLELHPLRDKSAVVTITASNSLLLPPRARLRMRKEKSAQNLIDLNYGSSQNRGAESDTECGTFSITVAPVDDICTERCRLASNTVTLTLPEFERFSVPESFKTSEPDSPLRTEGEKRHMQALDDRQINTQEAAASERSSVELDSKAETGFGTLPDLVFHHRDSGISAVTPPSSPTLEDQAGYWQLPNCLKAGIASADTARSAIYGWPSISTLSSSSDVMSTPQSPFSPVSEAPSTLIDVARPSSFARSVSEPVVPSELSFTPSTSLLEDIQTALPQLALGPEDRARSEASIPDKPDQSVRRHTTPIRRRPLPPLHRASVPLPERRSRASFFGDSMKELVAERNAETSSGQTRRSISSREEIRKRRAQRYLALDT